MVSALFTVGVQGYGTTTILRTRRRAALSVLRPPRRPILTHMNSDSCDLPTLEVQLGHAMALVRQDRWLLGALREGRLKVLSDSNPELHPPYRRTRALTHLAPRCLHERHP